MVLTVPELLRCSANVHPGRPAILATGRPSCSWDRLVRHVDLTVAALVNSGVQPGDRLAVVLPNGPEMATAFLASSAAATCAPLNPAYVESEFEFYLQDLRAASLIIAADDPGPARAVAKRLRIPVLDCRVRKDTPAGCFELAPSGDSPPRASKLVQRAAASSDIALVLHTSGTTARPKRVPLTHANLCTSARNIARTLHLGPADRCLNVLPLFHIHGLVAALLSTIQSGGSLVATAGFLTTHFFDWVEEFAPTWFTAVPTMHHALLARASHLDMKRPVGRMRFVRSSSAPLPAAVAADLEALFGAPVIDAYGMTEAAHQIASNPLPPAMHKLGSVGCAAGSEVAIIDEGARFVEVGVTGEVVVRGKNVTAGYDAAADANMAAFIDGWFRTGDQGRLDADGYLFLTGRLKELINRGGEKIAPGEIDEVFNAHPAVAQAAAFAVPDARLGEEIGVAVVLRQEHRVSSRDLLAFAAERLADFKLPRHVAFVGELPKGPTGKLQRVGLAGRIGIGQTTAADHLRVKARIPATPSERVVAAAFAEILRVEGVDAHSSFLRLGGDSLLAVSLSCHLEEKTGVEVPTYVLFEHDTVEALAAYIDDGSHSRGDNAPAVQLEPSAMEIPLTSQQEFHWTIETLFRGAPLNHRPGAIRISGPLDVARFQAALHGVLTRHPPLRTRVALRRLRPQLVVAPAESCAVHVENLSRLPPSAQRATLREIGQRFALESFDLLNGPLFKMLLVRLSETEHVLLINVHHMVFDGWSMSVLVSDLAELYEAHARSTNTGLPDLSISYSEHAIRQRNRFDQDQLKSSLDYWRSQLKGLPQPFSPVPDSLRDARPTGLGREFRVAADPVLSARITATGQMLAATPFMANLAVFAAFCRVLGAPDDFVLGAFVSGRSTPSVTRLIGCFYNLLPLRIDLSGDPTFADLVERTRRTTLAAVTHQHVPYGHLVRTLRPVGGRFFDVAFQCRNFPVSTAQAGTVSFADVPFDWGLAHWDLMIETTPRHVGSEVHFVYRSHATGSDPGLLWADAYRHALEWAASGNGRLSGLTCGDTA